jgi:hypothetical protein
MIRGTASLVLALVMAAVLFAGPCVACVASVQLPSSTCCHHHTPCKTARAQRSDLSMAKLIAPVQVPLPGSCLPDQVDCRNGATAASLDPVFLATFSQPGHYLLASQLNI